MASLHSPRPRVLHVYKDYYPPVLGGVEMTINLMAEGCSNEYDISVLVNSGSRHTSEEIINGVRVIRVAEWGRAASAPFSPAFISALARKARQADILHFHHPNPTGDLARFLSRPCPPAVMTYHSDVVRQQRAMAVYGPLQNWMMSQCRVIMPTSPNYMESSPWLARHRDRCTVVPLGIRVSDFDEAPAVLARAAQIKKRFSLSRDPPRPVILFVGRLRYYKGLQFLIAAMKEIDAELLLAGSGPMEPELRRMATSLQVPDRVHFLGDISDEEKLACYYAADVFCMPSHLRSEAFGLSQVEAMATGLPLVSTRIASGVPYVNADGVSGLSVEPENPQALAEAINRLLSNDDLRNRLGQGARDRARQEFSATRMCEDVKAVYKKCLAAKSGRDESPKKTPGDSFPTRRQHTIPLLMAASVRI